MKLIRLERDNYICYQSPKPPLTCVEVCKTPDHSFVWVYTKDPTAFIQLFQDNVHHQSKLPDSFGQLRCKELVGSDRVKDPKELKYFLKVMGKHFSIDPDSMNSIEKDLGIPAEKFCEEEKTSPR